MVDSTKLEVKYVSDLIRILLRLPAFIELLNNFGILLLENIHVTEAIENLQIRPKLTYILQNFCHNYGALATYERIVRVLNLMNLKSVAVEVESEASRIRQTDTYSQRKQFTKIEYKDIPEIRKILLKDCSFASEVNTFSYLLGIEIETANEAPKRNCNRVLYKFHQRFPETAVYEVLIDVLEKQMGHKKLADEIKTKFKVASNPKPVLPKLFQRKPLNDSQKSQPLTPTTKLIPKNVQTLKNQECQTSNSLLAAPSVASTLKSIQVKQNSLVDTCPKNNDREFMEDALKALETMEKADYEPEYIKIEDGATGHSYESLYGKYLTDSTYDIIIEDPYLEKAHQIHNLVALLHLISKRCPKVKKILIMTKNFSKKDSKKVDEAVDIDITVHRSKTIHDRWLKIWYMKTVGIGMGRGGDIFKPCKNYSQTKQEQLKCREFTQATVPDADFRNSTSSSDEIEAAHPYSPSKNGKGLKLVAKVKNISPEISPSNSSSDEIETPNARIPKKKNKGKGKKPKKNHQVPNQHSEI